MALGASGVGRSGSPNLSKRDGFSSPPSGSRGCISTAIYGGSIEGTFKTTGLNPTGKIDGEKTEPIKLHSVVPASQVFTGVRQVPRLDSADIPRKTLQITRQAQDFLNSILETLGVNEKVEIRFDEVITNQTTRMYVYLQEKKGGLIDVFRECVKEDATYFDYVVDYRQPNPERKVLEAIFADILILFLKQVLILKKGDDVLRDAWTNYGGSISIGPRNARYSEIMARKGDPQSNYRTYEETCKKLNLPNNFIFLWKNPKDFIDKYQSGDIAKRLSHVEGLKDISGSLPKIPPQVLSLLEQQGSGSVAKSADKSSVTFHSSH